MARRKAEPVTKVEEQEEITVQEQVVPTEVVIEAQVKEDSEAEDDVHVIEVIRHTQFFTNEINDETVQSLIGELNNYLVVDLYIASPGGTVSAANALIRYLNNRSGEIDIYLIDGIASAATFVLTDYYGNIFITDDLDYMMMHKIDRLMYTVRKDYLDNKQLEKQLKRKNKILLNKYIALGFTDKEIKRFKAGKDVILYQKDFGRLNLRCYEERE